MSLFDPMSLPRTPPPIRQAHRCGEQAPSFPSRRDLRRPPRCNRPNGHGGAHQEIRRQDFKVLHEWAGGD